MLTFLYLADSYEELHAMAAKIGVARKWWQSPEKTSGSHYDIALSKKTLAIQYVLLKSPKSPGDKREL